jgi:hypothetical protein
MSHPTDHDDATPLFAHLLVDDEQPVPAAGSGGTAPTYHCLDSECTKKYPSDADDCLSYKPTCDYTF